MDCQDHLGLLVCRAQQETLVLQVKEENLDSWDHQEHLGRGV